MADQIAMAVLECVRRGLPGIAGSAVLAALLCACGDAPPTVGEVLTEACGDARGVLGVAPTPVDADAEAAFMQVSREATQTVADVAADVAGRGDDRTIADLAWQLYRFPTATRADEVLGVAHEAQAAIVRIDGLAQTLQVRECGAATWRPADWRAIADRHAERPNDITFRQKLDRLCAETFPDPLLLADGIPLLNALVADTPARDGSPDEVKSRLIPRLNSVTTGPSAAARFIRDFSSRLPQIHPSADLEGEYVALLAAFMRLDSAVPRAMPRDPPPDVRERVNAALDELQHAWDELRIMC